MVTMMMVLPVPTAHAAESAHLQRTDSLNITPFWINVTAVPPDIGINDTTAASSVYIKATNNSASISGNMYLEKKDGTSWKTVKSWSISGKGSLNASKTYRDVISGTSYRTRISVKVSYNGNSETISETSASIKA